MLLLDFKVVLEVKKKVPMLLTPHIEFKTRNSFDMIELHNESMFTRRLF